MKFHLNHDPANKTLTIPRAALQLSGLADVSDLILHTDSGCILLLPGDPTVAELLKTISLISAVAPQLISRLAERSQMAMEAGMTETVCGACSVLTPPAPAPSPRRSCTARRAAPRSAAAPGSAT